jgi:hypothetical protein
MFGAPKTGIHAYRFANIAVVDVIGTFVIAFLIYFFAKWSFLWTLAGLFILGIVMHRIFCVRTTIDRILFT